MRGHDGARRDDRAAADRHARQDGGVRPHPDLVLDGDDGEELGGGAAQGRVERMAGGDDRDVRAEQDALADADLGVVEDVGAGAESTGAEPAGTGLSAGTASLLMGAIGSGAGGGASGTGGARGEQVAAAAALGRGGGLDERLGLLVSRRAAGFQ